MTSGTEPFDLSVIHPEGPVPLVCDLDHPSGPARGTVIVVHGFKGYKDYGMFPFLARQLATVGQHVVRVNLAHSGMTRAFETFARPDLFERDTWNRQVQDLEALVDAIRSGAVPGIEPALPITLLGHSRGGVASILMAGRSDAVDHVISVSAPASTRGTSDLGSEERAQLDAEGFLEVESARTGQLLRVGRAFHDEVDADPESHDVPAHAARLGRRLTVFHGEADPTVPAEAARVLAVAAGGDPILVPGGNHVFNVANPFPADGVPSPELQVLLDRVLDALGEEEAS